MINVTKTYLPPRAEYDKYLNRIWANGWITNNGELVRELESKLKDYFDVKHLFYVSNGTIALQIAMKAMEVTGEVITTPFSYVATTGSIIWENCKPRFVDIDDQSFGINPALIEDKISDETSAILATHVYGIPNDIEEIQKIAKRNNLKLIFDAAHCFGTKYGNQSIMQFGDISTISFHATKLFHTIEGGAITTDNDELANKIDLYRRFGHSGDDYYTIGINGKNSEFHAAMGLTLFPKVSEFIAFRKSLVEYYDSFIQDLPLKRPLIKDADSYNYAYYPVIFESEAQLLKTKEVLENNEIVPRRYFYPSLNKLPYIDQIDSCPVSESIASRALCLPLFVDLETDQIDRIVSIIKESLS